METDTLDELSFMKESETSIFNRKQLGILTSYTPPALGVAEPVWPSSLYIILKATRLCNLRCSYCNAWREGPGQVLQFETLVDVIAQTMRLPGVKWLNIVWHGGETTMLSRRYFKRALWLQEHWRIDDRKVGHAIQTNATRLNDAWCRFFKAAGLSVGVSVDLNRETHDAQRVYAKGGGTYADVMRGLALLRSHEVNHGVLSVIGEAAIADGPRRMLDDLCALEVSTVGLLNALPPNESGGAGAAYLPFDRYVTFLRELFALWHGEYRERITLRELASLSGIVAGSRSRLCLFQGGCMGQYLTIEPDGRVSACDKYVGDDDHCFGSLGETTLDDILSQSRALERAREQATQDIARFRDCPNFHYCQGGCPHDNKLNKSMGWEKTCCGLFDLIEDMKVASNSETL